MKIVLQALLGSLFLHVVYFLSTMAIGYVKTRHFKPDLGAKWENVTTLQNEVAFSMVISPVTYLVTLIVVAGICGIILVTIKTRRR
jgi:hypothetical protein